MSHYSFFTGLLAGTWLMMAPAGAQTAGGADTKLKVVATFPTQQVTGVTVSKSGRIFVNFPYWSDAHGISVAELVNGQPQPYPTAAWNEPGAPAEHLVCVQSVVVDDTDSLWILDPAAPKMESTVPGGPKLLKVDLTRNEVVQKIPFGGDIALKKSYLNDVRVDTAKQMAYITDSGVGGIIVVDLKSGKARRCLSEDVSIMAEPGFRLVVDGKELIDQKSGKPPVIHSDGIALDAANGYLYYHALTGHHLYRVKTEDLNNTALAQKELAARVEDMGETAAPDGMLEAKDGSIYMTDLEGNAVTRFNPQTKKIAAVASDKRLMWPDTMSWGPDGALYVTASQIENMPRFNGGKSARTEPYGLYKLMVP